MTALPQHLQALQLAQQRRMGASEIRNQLRAMGRKRGAEAAWTLAGVITNPDENVGSAKVATMLKAIPGMGDTAARKCLTAAGVPNGEKRVRDLTDRQRNSIAGQLAFWAETRR